MRPNSITENGYQATFSYNVDNQRVKMQIKKDGNNYLTRYYLGNVYEIDNKVGETKEKLYFGGSYYDAYAVYVKQGGAWQLNYICRDYLGSITHITNNTGTLLTEYSYDAWGRLRNPVNQSVYAPESVPDLLLGRGYTGHEHLAVFGLVNMNARLYDPILGRFLSPDPYVQLPDNLQGFNRYTYGMNNPLCYVDENGEVWWFVAAAVAGGIINVAMNWNRIDNFWQGLGYFGVGAVSGALGYVTGGAVSTALGGLSGFAGGAVIGAASGASSGFVLGGGNAILSGGDFWDVMRDATTGMFMGAATGMASGAIIGGAISYFQGKNVWTGADIAKGRNPFSLKNTSIGDIEHPEAGVTSKPSNESAIPASDDPLLNHEPMTPRQKGDLGVQEAMREFKAEGGIVHAQEVTVELDGVRTRFDFVGSLDEQLHLVEVKTGPHAGFTPNQKINIPKYLTNKSTLIPRGANAIKVPKFQNYIDKQFTSHYVVVIKHYF